MDDDQAARPRSCRSPWTAATAEAVIMAPYGAARQSEHYAAAKQNGDARAAYEVVLPLVNREGLGQIAAKMPDRSRALVVPVVSEERLGKNMIPRAYAEILAAKLGIDTAIDIVHVNKVNRGGSDGFHRLAVQPEFAGPVVPGQGYIIVDDTITQGGTLACLKGHIENNGGVVLVVSALTGKRYSARLEPEAATLAKLRVKHPSLEAFWHEHFGYGFDLLTHSEANYLATVKGRTADGIRDRILAAGGY